MAQQSETRRRSVRRAQDGSNAVAMAIMKGQSFFHKVFIRSSGLQKTYLEMLELRWLERVANRKTLSQAAQKG